MISENIRLAHNPTTVSSAIKLLGMITRYLDQNHGLKPRDILIDITDNNQNINGQVILIDKETLDFVSGYNAMNDHLAELAINNKFILIKDDDRKFSWLTMDDIHKDIIYRYITDDPNDDDEKSLQFPNLYFIDPLDDQRFFNQSHDNSDDRFFCLMAKKRHQRDMLVFELNKQDLIRKNIVVYDEPPKRISKLSSRQYDVPVDGSCLSWHYHRLCAEVVVEALTNYKMITEKTVRPLAAGMPFFLVAGKGTLSYLRDIGFETYHEYFDESYDEITDDDYRIKRMVESLKDVMKRKRELVKIYKDSEHIRNNNSAMASWFTIYKETLVNSSLDEIFL